MTFSLSSEVIRGTIEDHSPDHRIVAAVAGWSASSESKGPSGIGCVILRSHYDGSKNEVEWSVRLGTSTRPEAQKAAEAFFWSLLKMSRNVGYQKVPLTWMCSGENAWRKRAMILAKRAALVDGARVFWRVK